MSVETASQPKVYANRGPRRILEPADLYFTPEGLITGRVSDDGVPLKLSHAIRVEGHLRNCGNSQYPCPDGLTLFIDNQPSLISLESSDGQIRTFAQAQVQSFYRAAHDC